MERLIADLEELLCRLEASYRRPVSLESLLYLMPQHVCRSVLDVNLKYEELWDFMKRFPTLFALHDTSKRVSALSTSCLTYDFLRSVFTLARRTKLSARYVKSECCLRGDWLLEALLTCLGEFDDVFKLEEPNVIKVAGPDYEAVKYGKATLSRFTELLLLKLSSSGARRSHWPLEVLESYLSECPIRKKAVDLAELFRQYKDVYEIVQQDSGLTVALKRPAKPEWDIVLIARLRAYLFSKRAFSKASAVPLSEVANDVCPGTVGKETVEAALSSHKSLFVCDGKVRVASDLSNDTAEKMVEASLYFYRILRALVLCGHRRVCYNVLLSCVEVAPSSVKRFLHLEFPNLALIDFFRFMPEFFDVSQPNCVRPVLVKSIDCLDSGRIGTEGLEAMAVQRLVALLWIVSGRLRIEVLVACLDCICPDLKPYCLERYKMGLAEFFEGYPSIFRVLPTDNVIELALETPRFSADSCRLAGLAMCPASKGGFYERVVTAIGVIDTRSLDSREFLEAFTYFPESFVLQDDKAFLATDDQEDSMAVTACSLLCCSNKRNVTKRNENAMEQPCLENKKSQCSGATGSLQCSNLMPMQKVETSNESYPVVKTSEKLVDKQEDKPAAACDLVPSQCDLDDVANFTDDFDLDCPYEDVGPDVQLTPEEISVQYFLELLNSSSGIRSIAEMEAMLEKCPNIVRAFCRNNFQRGLVTFFQAYSSDFEVTVDGKIRPVVHKLLTGCEEHSTTTSVGDGATKFCRVLKVQSLAARTNEYLRGLLKAKDTRYNVDVVREVLRVQNPMLLGYCDDNYRHGLQGFLKCNPHAYDVSATGKTFVLRTQEPLEYGSCLGKILQKTSLDGLIASEQFSQPLFFPAWAFVDPKCLASLSLSSDLKVGDSVEFCFSRCGTSGDPSIFCVTKVENLEARKMVKVPCDCTVVFAGPYYALLGPKFVRGNEPNHPRECTTIVYCYESSFDEIAVGERVIATVQPGYPSSLLWKAYQLLTRGGVCHPGIAVPDSSKKSEVSVEAKQSSPSADDGRRMAVGYYLSAITRLGCEASVMDLEWVSQKSPDAVKAYIRENFSGGPMDFFRSQRQWFKELDHGKIRLVHKASPPQRVTERRESHGVLRDPKATFGKSNVVVRAITMVPTGITSKKKRKTKKEKYREVISGIGTLSVVLEREAVVTSESLPHALVVPAPCLVAEDGSTSAKLGPEWEAGQAVDFTAVRGSAKAELRVACILPLVTWLDENCFLPETRVCKVTLVWRDYVLLDIPSETGVKAVAGGLDTVPLRTSQRIEVEVLPRYPSSSLWKAVKVVKLL